MNTDEFWPQGPQFLKTEDAFPIGTDAVLLAAFAQPPACGRVLDLGTGSGVISLLLAWENRTLQIDGVDIQSAAIERARENAKINGLEAHTCFFTEDIRTWRQGEKAGQYPLVVCNPPYFPVGSGKSSAEEKMAIAREERFCNLQDVCLAAAYYTKWGGRFAIVYRPERLVDLFCCLRENGLEPKRLRMVQATPSAMPNLVLVESRRGGKSGLIIEKPLIMQTETGKDTEEIQKIYHRGEN